VPVDSRLELTELRAAGRFDAQEFGMMGTTRAVATGSTGVFRGICVGMGIAG